MVWAKKRRVGGHEVHPRTLVRTRLRDGQKGIVERSGNNYALVVGKTALVSERTKRRVVDVDRKIDFGRVRIYRGIRLAAAAQALGQEYRPKARSNEFKKLLSRYTSGGVLNRIHVIVV